MLEIGLNVVQIILSIIIIALVLRRMKEDKEE